ncbi:MAG: methyltransferase type 11, partial [Candidatus Heimdallarchaeota archaeon]|nr:methyltransferase type 11 [Candidatus Heimdallarchaeota archaeon]
MDKKKIVREGYDEVAEKYIKYRLKKQVKMDYVVEFSSMIEVGGRILDAGCGAGLPFTKYLSEYFEVIGID